MQNLRPEDFEEARKKWAYRGQKRPDFAETPGPGQESVWDYPRPPRCEPVPQELSVFVGETCIAASTDGLRVCETAGAPTYYLPFRDIKMEWMEDLGPRSLCEWKGIAHPFAAVVNGVRVKGAAWRYPEPWPGFEELAETLAFHPAHVICKRGEEVARPQAGGLYGGWITSDLVGPIKGGPGTGHW
ncbi:MAG: DUF427 domain-containing protein [Myxococcota bacterium]